MKSAKRKLQTMQKAGRTVLAAGKNTRKSHELATAAGQVVTKRMAIGAEAMINPLGADYVELARIVPEKTVAFSAARMSVLQHSGAIARQMTGFATREMSAAVMATINMASCRTPAGLINIQQSFATAWAARMMSQLVTMSSLAMQAQSAALLPMHRVVTANARRLAR